MIAIGIDLGTTNSCVAVYQHGKVEIIANEIGERTTPSAVAFTETQILIGKAAKKKAAINPSNTIFSIKRLIGRRLTDPSVIQDCKTWPFKVSGANYKPVIEVQYKNEKKLFSPEEISAMILSNMKKVAETYLGQKVENAVITVPAYFNNSQRQATIDAAKIAGLNLMRLINEPTAAAIAYGFDKKVNSERNILVFDLGGGTLDVSVMRINNGVHEVKATSGDTHLGGNDFDNRLVYHFVKQFTQMHGEDISKDKKAMMRLLNKCEVAKCHLSGMLETSLDLDYFLRDIHFDPCITRSVFEELNEDLFNSMLEPIERVLEDAKMSEDRINEVLLIGRSTRIPKVRDLIQRFFWGKELNESINPDEAVAYGAAVQAAILSHEKSQKVLGIELMDVTPLSLGINTLGGKMRIVIKRNTPIPTTRRQTYITVENHQSAIEFIVYEGEQLMSSDNNLLGTFKLQDITRAPRGAIKVNVTFHLQINGILEVSAIERSKTNQNSITIAMDIGRFSNEEIDRMLADAERFQKDDERNARRVDAKCSLEQFVNFVRLILEYDEVRKSISQSNHETICAKFSEVRSWLEVNQNADEDQFNHWKKVLEETWERAT